MYQWCKIDISALPLQSITGNSIKVFLALACIMDEEHTAQCSYGALCSSLSISKRTAYRSIRELEYHQLLYRMNISGQVLTVKILRSISVGRGNSPQDHPLGHKQDWVPPYSDKIGT